MISFWGEATDISATLYSMSETHRHIRLAEVQARGLFKRLMPHLKPKDRNANELLADKVCLLYKHGNVRLDLIDHSKRAVATTDAH